VEKTSATPTTGNGYLYVTTSGFIGDQGHYVGHVVSINLVTARVHVFNSLCSNIHRLLGPDSSHSNYCSDAQSGLFGRGQGVIDPNTRAVYVVSGNGPWNGRTNWGDSILELDSSGQRPMDSYTPTNQESLNNQDLDLGSTGPAILPVVHSGGKVYRLLVQGGKGPQCDGCGGVVLRLLNRANLSGRGGPGHLGGDLSITQAPGGCEVLTAPVVWTSPTGQIWIFYANDCGTAGYRLITTAPGRFQLRQDWHVSARGTTPVMSHGVLYVARSGVVVGYDAVSHDIVWRGAGIGAVHWEYPLVIGRRLFMTDEVGHVTAFNLPKARHQQREVAR
jgi:hypothetical protein